MTRQLQLEPEEVEAVRDVLHAAISDLSPEIANTDNPEYRRGLKARRDPRRGSSRVARRVEPAWVLAASVVRLRPTHTDR